MKKSLIIGVATLALTGTALIGIGTGIYAATADTPTESTEKSSRMERRGGPENMLTSMKSTLSTEAYTALETLMNKHKAEMETARSSSTTVDETTMKAQHEAFKTEMDALIAKYPEIKTAMDAARPTGEKGGKMGGRGGRGNNALDTALAALPTDAQTEIQTIRDGYKAKFEALRTEEDTRVEAVIAKYPAVKTAYDTAKASRPTNDDKQPPMDPPTETATTATSN